MPSHGHRNGLKLCHFYSASIQCVLPAIGQFSLHGLYAEKILDACCSTAYYCIIIIHQYLLRRILHASSLGRRIWQPRLRTSPTIRGHCARKSPEMHRQTARCSTFHGASVSQKIILWLGKSLVLAAPQLTTRDPQRPQILRQHATCIPGRWQFVLRRSFVAAITYLLVDLIESTPQDPNATALFRSEVVPVFSRWHDVTFEEVKLRFIAFGMFTFTFFNIIQCYSSAGSAIAVALDFSRPEDWRPCFGDFAEAYCLKNAWG